MSEPTNNAILAELQEDFRREQFKQWMNRYGGAVLVLAVLLVLGTGAYTMWQQHQEGKLQAVTANLYDAIGPQAQQKPAEAADRLKTFAAQYPDNEQGDLAALLAAGLEKKASQPQEALALFSKVAESAKTDASLKGVATMLYVETALNTDTSPADLQAKLAPYQAADSAFRFTAWELGALAAHKAGDYEKARAFLDQLMKDSDTPNTQRQRAAELQRVL